MEPNELRYSDCPSTEAEIFIQAPPRAVWALISDINLPARFSSEFLGASWVGDDTAPRLGAQFVGRNQHPAIGEWETTSTITELEDERRLAWAVGDAADPSALWRFTLAPAGEGDAGTDLVFAMRMGPARSGINLAIDAMPDKESRILHRRLSEHRANIEATLAGVKELAES